MARRRKARSAARGAPTRRAEAQLRDWRLAVALAGVLTVVAVAVSALVNPLFDRAVHWVWMAYLAPTVFVLSAISLRRRWI